MERTKEKTADKKTHTQRKTERVKERKKERKKEGKKEKRKKERKTERREIQSVRQTKRIRDIEIAKQTDRNGGTERWRKRRRWVEKRYRAI